MQRIKNVFCEDMNLTVEELSVFYLGSQANGRSRKFEVRNVSRYFNTIYNFDTMLRHIYHTPRFRRIDTYIKSSIVFQQ